VTRSAIKLDTMSIYLGSAYSSQSLKSRPIRYLLLEEPDEYPAASGGGGDPIAKAMKRVTTYAAKGRARVIIGGTPTTRIGNVYKRFESCSDQRHFWVPCPHCGAYQRLYWQNVKYLPRLASESRRAHAARVLDGGDDGAWYECEKCHGKINEEQKRRMLSRGLWAGSDQVVTPDGRVVGPARKARRIGFCLPATYSPWASLALLASEWIEAQDERQALIDFVNQRLAEPAEEQIAKSEPTIFEEKAKGAGPPMLVPKWARALIATADTQGVDEATGYFWYVIRAWGYDYRSQLVDFGVAHSKAELLERCLNRLIPIEGGGLTAPQMLVTDSGGPRWSEVYQLAQSDPRIHPSKGRDIGWLVEERPQRKHNVVLWLINTEQSKDLLHRLIHDPDRSKWLPHNQINDDYSRQMCAESKIFDPATKRERWIEIVKNNNHLFDCEQQQAAAAWRIGCGSPEPAPEVPPPVPKSERPDWMPDRPDKWIQR
jgi:phage terminase large subunit GpA-like protein